MPSFLQIFKKQHSFRKSNKLGVVFTSCFQQKLAYIKPPLVWVFLRTTPILFVHNFKKMSVFYTIVFFGKLKWERCMIYTTSSVFRTEKISLYCFSASFYVTLHKCWVSDFHIDFEIYLSKQLCFQKLLRFFNFIMCHFRLYYVISWYRISIKLLFRGKCGP